MHKDVARTKHKQIGQTLAIRHSMIVGDYSMLHHIPELKQHLIENKFSKAAHRDVLGIIYILDCFLTNRHKHYSHDKNSDGYIMALDYKLLDKLFTQAVRKKLVRWKESDLLGNTAVVNPEHLLSKFMYTTGTYDKESGESREWYIRDNIAYRLMDFVAGYANHVKTIPRGYRESGQFGKVSVCQHGKVDKWLDTKTGVTYNKHSELASQLGVAEKTVKQNWQKTGRIIKNPNAVNSNRVGFALYDRYINTYTPSGLESQKSTYDNQEVRFSKTEPLGDIYTYPISVEENPHDSLTYKRDGNKWLDETKILTTTISRTNLEDAMTAIDVKLFNHRKYRRMNPDAKMTLEMISDLQNMSLLTSLSESLLVHKGYIESVYQKHLYGRWYITNHDCNLQTLPRWLRKDLLSDKYEYDLSAAHPSIILSIVGEEHLPHIKQYIDNKDKWRTELSEHCGASKQEVKDSINALNNLSKLNHIYTKTMNSESLKKFNEHPFVNAYKKDMELASEHIIQYWLDSGNSFHEETNTKSKKLACVLQNIEAWGLCCLNRWN